MKNNFGEILEALKLREFRNILIYMGLSSIVTPTFGMFDYYFFMDVVKLSKFTFAMLSVFGFITLFIGT